MPLNTVEFVSQRSVPTLGLGSGTLMSIQVRDIQVRDIQVRSIQVRSIQVRDIQVRSIQVRDITQLGWPGWSILFYYTF